jgi:hypothetical protein
LLLRSTIAVRLFARRKRGRQAKVAAASQINDLPHAGSEAGWIVHAMPLLWLGAWAVVFYAGLLNALAAPDTKALVLGVVLDVSGPIAVWAISRAWRQRRWGMVCFSAAIILFALGWTIVSAFNTAAEGTIGREQSLQLEAKQQADLAADIKAAEAELQALAGTRATVTIQAAISAIVDDPRADGCKAINGKFTREECPRLGSLRAELGAAKARDQAKAKLADLRAKQRPATSGREPGADLAERFGIPGDSIPLARTILFVVVLETLKLGIVAWVAWLTPRSSPGSIAQEGLGRPPDALPKPARTKGPKKQGATPEPSAWLLDAFASDRALPAGIVRVNGGLQASYAAFAAAWGVSTSKAYRLVKGWQDAGAFVVRSSSRGTWIGPAQARLRAIS